VKVKCQRRWTGIVGAWKNVATALNMYWMTHLGIEGVYSSNGHFWHTTLLFPSFSFFLFLCCFRFLRFHFSPQHTTEIFAVTFDFWLWLLFLLQPFQLFSLRTPLFQLESIDYFACIVLFLYSSFCGRALSQPVLTSTFDLLRIFLLSLIIHCLYTSFCSSTLSFIYSVFTSFVFHFCARFSSVT